MTRRFPRIFIWGLLPGRSELEAGTPPVPRDQRDHGEIDRMARPVPPVPGDRARQVPVLGDAAAAPSPGAFTNSSANWAGTATTVREFWHATGTGGQIASSRTPYFDIITASSGAQEFSHWRPGAQGRRRCLTGRLMR